MYIDTHTYIYIHTSICSKSIVFSIWPPWTLSFASAILVSAYFSLRNYVCVYKKIITTKRWNGKPLKNSSIAWRVEHNYKYIENHRSEENEKCKIYIIKLYIFPSISLSTCNAFAIIINMWTLLVSTIATILQWELIFSKCDITIFTCRLLIRETNHFAIIGYRVKPRINRAR